MTSKSSGSGMRPTMVRAVAMTPFMPLSGELSICGPSTTALSELKNSGSATVSSRLAAVSNSALPASPWVSRSSAFRLYFWM